MRYFILSDIHSNVEALEACIQRAKEAGYEGVLCCGDLVGYGPNPVEAIDMMRTLNAVTIRGNHDRVAAGLDEAAQFNSHARRAVYWTRAVLPQPYREYLGSLPVGPLDIDEDAQLVHGAITDEDDYIFTEADANENFPLANAAHTMISWRLSVASRVTTLCCRWFKLLFAMATSSRRVLWNNFCRN